MPKKGALVDEKKINALRVLEKDSAQAEIDDWNVIMGTPNGRRFLYRLIFEKCGVNNGIWDPSAAIHYREGRRSIGIELMNDAQEFATSQYLEMINERILANAENAQGRAAVAIEESTDEENSNA